MIDDLRHYPAMNYSGVPWLGNVPEHWEIHKLKRIVRLQSGESITAFDIHEEGAHPVYGGNGQRGYTSGFTHEGEFVLIGRQGALCGNINYAKGRFWASEHALVAHPRRSFPVRWLGELLRTMNLNQYAISAAQPGLSVERIEPLAIPYPPFDEQLAIARFLDHVDRLSRRYVSAKRRLIKLLEEQKQAIVQRAVTRGLDPNVPLEPSGVEWLGDVPEHWEVRRGKYYFREVDERSGDGSEELLSVSHKSGVTPRSEKNVTMFMAHSYVGHKLCRPGDIVVNTMWGWMAAAGVAERLGIVSPSYGVYRPREPDDFRSQYLDFLLRTELYRGEYVRSSRGITTSRLRLYPDDFLRIEFICPPLEEQDAILDWIGKATAELRRAIAAAKREIYLLNEYRTRLIADVVTGKLDVRPAAMALHEIAELPDAVEISDDTEVDEEVLDEEAETEEAA
ncbi:MAG: restriction endonuclease subunit S [Dongiaceae bacterium]